MREKRRPALLKLMKENHIPYRCRECGIENWMGKPLTIQIDHKDGNRNNNDINNLRFLCPNCHAQTDNFCGKSEEKNSVCKACNKLFQYRGKSERVYCSGKCSAKGNQKYILNRGGQTKIDWPIMDELKKLVIENGYTGTAKLLGVSDAAIHNRIKRKSNQIGD